ncbi:hypothetical protein AAKU55_003364 [Oxalobacteraceae bacterium GrIS 1.11]
MQSIRPQPSSPTALQMSGTASSSENAAPNHADASAASVRHARPPPGRSVTASARSGQLRHEFAVSQFKEYPAIFSTSHAISADGMTKEGALPASGHAKLVPAGADTYELRFTEHADAHTVPAHFLNYINIATQGIKPAYVDIPKQAEEGKFLFTGTLSGCSLIVTDLNADTYRVFHDSRPNSSTLHDNAVMGTDFKDYQVAGKQEGLANAFLHFSGGQWKMITQRQEYSRTAAGGTEVKLREDGKVLSMQTADPTFIHRTQAHLTQIRADSQKKLIAAAKELGIPADLAQASDAPYERSAEPKERDHPSIASWNALRGRVKEVVGSAIEDEREKKSKLPGSENQRNKLQQQQFEVHNRVLEHYKQFHNIVEESLTADLTWLREQKKSVEGSAAVVQTGEHQG